MAECLCIRTCPHGLIENSTTKPLIYTNFQEVMFSNANKVLDQNLQCSSEHCQFKREHLWICLQCGGIFCGKNANNHTTSHFERTNHVHFLSFTYLQIWCYICNSFVESEKAHEQINRLMKDFQRKFDSWRREKERNIMVDQYSSTQPQELASVNKLHMLCEQYLTNVRPSIPLKVECFGNIGILNKNSTCYISAVVQCLSHLPYFCRYFWTFAPFFNQKDSISKKTNSQIDVIINNLKTMYCLNFIQTIQALQINNPDKKIIHIQQLFVSLQALFKQYIGARQQDAAEYLHFSLDALKDFLRLKFQLFPYNSPKSEEEFIPQSYLANPLQFFPQTITRPNRDIVTDCFECIVHRQFNTQCQNCKLSILEDRKEPVSWNYMQQAGTFEQSLLKHMDVQEHETTCQKCGQQIKQEESAKFYYLPPLLVFQTSHMAVKPSQIDFSKYLSDNSPHLRYQAYLNTEIGSKDEQFLEKYVAQGLAQLFAKEAVDKMIEKIKLRSRDQQKVDNETQNLAVEAISAYALTFASELSQIIQKSLTMEMDKKHNWNNEEQINNFFKYTYKDVQESANKQLPPDQKCVFLKNFLINVKTSKQYQQRNLKIPFDQDALMAGSPIYDLQAVIPHIGDDQSGHYKAIIKDFTVAAGQPPVWQLFDDQKISLFQGDNMPQLFQDVAILFFQKQKSSLQEALQQFIYNEIYQENATQQTTKVCAKLFTDFYPYMQRFIQTTLQLQVKTKQSQYLLSGDWLYKLQQLPWASSFQGGMFREECAQYAIQPFQLPAYVNVSHNMIMLISAVFGHSQMLAPTVPEPKTQQSECVLIDKILCGPTPDKGKRRFAISQNFLNKWCEFLFDDGLSRFMGVVNSDFSDPHNPLNRFCLIENLREDVHYKVIGEEQYEELKKYYQVFEVELFGADIYSMPGFVE